MRYCLYEVEVNNIAIKLEKIHFDKDTIEDLDTIRNEAAIGATMAQNFSIISNEDIDTLFDTNN